MNDILRIARLRIALQRAFLGRAILRVIVETLTKAKGFVLSPEPYHKFMKIQHQDIDQTKASKAQPNVRLKVLTKLQL